MFVAAMIGILVTMALALCRALLGPTVYDRILAVEHVWHQNRVIYFCTRIFDWSARFFGSRPDLCVDQFYRYIGGAQICDLW